MMAFATAEDLATFLQRDLDAADTATAELLLDLATGAIRAFTGQTISLVAGDVVTLDPPTRGMLLLPQTPVTTITSVVAAGTTLTPSIDYAWSPNGIVYVPTAWRWATTRQSVVVTYSHGYATIPDEVRGVCLEVAAALMNLPTRGGIRSESVGSYSVSYDTSGETARQTVQAVEAGRLGRFRDLVVA